MVTDAATTDDDDVVGATGRSVSRSSPPSVHRHEDAGLRQLADADHGASWSMLAHLLHVDSVHRLEVAHVLQEHVDVHDVKHMSDFRSEEHTSELQSRGHLVCRLLLEKKKNKKKIIIGKSITTPDS